MFAIGASRFRQRSTALPCYRGMRSPYASFVAAALSVVVAIGCRVRQPASTAEDKAAELATQPQSVEKVENSAYAKAREDMVAAQLVARDIVDQRVIEAMRRVPRHEFVPRAVRPRAYDDGPLPIGHGQTISQPYIVALMTQLIDAAPQEKALDIGTGSGYQAAVLAELVSHVYSIEIVKPLAVEARQRLAKLSYKNITVRHGDGYEGWESEAPFDIIVVAAAPDHLPPALIEQLARGGKLVIPVGKFSQELLLVEKDSAGDVVQRRIAPVAFVPMTGAAERK